jgi:hypothetical protein
MLPLVSKSRTAQVAPQKSNVLKVKLSFFNLLEPTEATSKLSENHDDAARAKYHPTNLKVISH